jgi:long-chain acyl-CoA synthetase
MKGLKADPKKAKKLQSGIKRANALHFSPKMRKKLFKPIHGIFGGRMRLIILGGAPVNPEILKFFQDMGFLCVQGYGLTECAPILALNRDVAFKNHAAGLPLPGCDVKILDPDSDGIGEFISKGDNNFLGYYNDPENTAIALDKDGYYHTGDLGYIDEDGFCIITGRKKNVIITRNGKNVFPEELEYYLGRVDAVAESMVWAESDESGQDDTIVASIRPDMEVVKEALGEENANDEEKVKEYLWTFVDEINADLPLFKKIKKISIRKEEFEKNTAHKIKRFVDSNKK